MNTAATTTIIIIIIIIIMIVIHIITTRIAINRIAFRTRAIRIKTCNTINTYDSCRYGYDA